MTELEQLRERNAELVNGLQHAKVAVATLIGFANDASGVMEQVEVAMRATHPEIAASARAFVANWAEFLAGAQAAKNEGVLTNAPTTSARN
jgi:hypothetical protein